jgi:hypothetical protein
MKIISFSLKFCIPAGSLFTETAALTAVMRRRERHLFADNFVVKSGYRPRAKEEI